MYNAKDLKQLNRIASLNNEHSISTHKLSKTALGRAANKHGDEMLEDLSQFAHVTHALLQTLVTQVANLSKVKGVKE